MACPTCGADEGAAEAIAPGYWECRAQRLANVLQPGIGGNATGAPQPIYIPCNTRYQSAGQVTAFCACGMGAIARCSQCAAPLCGPHHVIYAGTVLCREHAAEKASAASEYAAQVTRSVQAEEHAAETRRIDGLIEELAELRSRSPIEATVRAIAEFSGSTYNRLLEQVPDTWNDAEIGRWFAATCKEPTSDILVQESKRFGGGTKDVRRPGWAFTAASSHRHRYPHGIEQLGTIVILTDGRVYYDRSFTPEPGERISRAGIKMIYDRAGLNPKFGSHRR